LPNITGWWRPTMRRFERREVCAIGAPRTIARRSTHGVERNRRKI